MDPMSREISASAPRSRDQDWIRTRSGPDQDRIRTRSGPDQDRIRTVSMRIQVHVAPVVT
ncbi:hypothetical protein EYF80_056833 [Liparis tanakae]|uniref:Uncharacterized protein n=1 Tax=Liparis tanakae TaxID=230148 RepID=A0A4Z2EVV0_9TELE|nr:hypothetical protein EYF80_056833 [Liparis tanakae]